MNALQIVLGLVLLVTGAQHLREAWRGYVLGVVEVALPRLPLRRGRRLDFSQREEPGRYKLSMVFHLAVTLAAWIGFGVVAVRIFQSVTA